MYNSRMHEGAVPFQFPSAPQWSWSLPTNCKTVLELKNNLIQTHFDRQIDEFRKHLTLIISSYYVSYYM